MVIERKNNQFSNLFDDRNNNLLEWKIINSGAEKSEIKFKQDSNNHIVVTFPPLVNDTILVPLKHDSYSIPTVIDDPKLKVEIVFQGISFPTSMAFLGPNDILVLEKNTGNVHRITNGQMLPQPLLHANVATQIERGMLGIAVTKNGPTTYVFLYYTEAGGGVDNSIGNRLYRYELANNQLINPKLLLDLPAIPGNPNSVRFEHNGGKLVVGPDNNVYLVIGDVGSHMGQTENNANGPPPDGTGGILRVTQDGEAVVPNSPLGNDTDPTLNKYYAYGIRNSFGMDFDPVTGKLWDTENGPAYGDEINLVEPGFNSGWTKIQGSAQTRQLNPANVLVNIGGKGTYRDPEFVWSQPIAPTALKFLNSDKLGKQYQNDMFVGDIINGNLYHFKLNEQRTGLLVGKVAANQQEIVFGNGFGGITDIQVGPDGYLYVLSYSGTIYRIVPASA
jgi:glucose/arabinose dehydrogenase